MIKAVIFDMNGVIIDDEHIHELAFKETVKPFGIDLDHSDYLACCAGKTDKAGYESIAENFNKILPVSELLEEKSKAYLELFPENKKSYPHVIELINELSHQYTLALTSSSSRDEVNLIIEEFGIKDKFIVTISANEVTKGKPDPEPYLITCSKLGIKPEDAVVIEDSRSGVMSAKTAGCFCIGITTTHTNDDLKQCDIVIRDFTEINKDLINSLGA